MAIYSGFFWNFHEISWEIQGFREIQDMPEDRYPCSRDRFGCPHTLQTTFNTIFFENKKTEIWKSCFRFVSGHLATLDYQNRVRRICLPRGEFFWAPGSSGELQGGQITYRKCIFWNFGCYFDGFVWPCSCPDPLPAAPYWFAPLSKIMFLLLSQDQLRVIRERCLF